MNREKLNQVLPAGEEALKKLGISRERDPRVRKRLFSWRMFVLILLVLLVLSAGNVLNVYARYRDENDQIWYEVATESGKTQGYVRDYVVNVLEIDKNAETLTYEAK